jgi:flagellar hook-length control protein FliK
MTAFASIIFAALPGLGAKSGADGAVTADGQAMAGQGGGDAFQALLAGLTAAAPAQPDAQAAAAATPLSTPAAAVLGAGVGAVPGGAPDANRTGLTSGEADDVVPVIAEGEIYAAAEALVAAATVVVAPTPTADKAVATPDGSPRRDPAVASPATTVTSAVPQAETRADAPGTAARPTPEAVAEVSVAPSPMAPATQAPATQASATQAAAQGVTSLIGRVLDGARKSGAEATVGQAVAEATPVEVPSDVAVDTPVELAVDTALSPDAPVPVEAAVVETPVAPSSSSSRRAVRADAVRPDVAAEAVDDGTPDLKPVARADARPTVDAPPAPLVRPELAAAPAPLADIGAETEPATLDTTAATPTLQAAAEMPAETAPTRGSPETVARLASDIARKLEGKTTRFDVQLDPLGLGKVDVSIEINADGRLSASLSFDSAQTAADLRGRAGELRQALEKAGFDLADGGLSFDMNNPGGSGGREARETLAAWSSRAFQTARSGLEQADALAARSISSRTPSGGVDIRI